MAIHDNSNVLTSILNSDSTIELPVSSAGTDSTLALAPADAAVERMAARIEALGTTDLLPMNRDVQRAADLVLKTLPVFEQHRALLDATYKVFDFSRLDSLRDACYAAMYHNGSAYAAPLVDDGFRAAVDKAEAARDTLTAVVKMLVSRTLLASRVVEELTGRTGYSDTAADVTRMVVALRASWPKVSMRAGMTKEEVDAALVDANTLSDLLAKREKGDARFAAATLLKQQSFTLLVRDYDYVRAAVAFALELAGKPPIPTLMPSIYALKKSRKSSLSNEQDTPEPDDADAQEDAPTEPKPSDEATTGVEPTLGEVAKPFLD
jgi:hypothetical protein